MTISTTRSVMVIVAVRPSRSGNRSTPVDCAETLPGFEEGGLKNEKEARERASAPASALEGRAMRVDAPAE